MNGSPNLDKPLPHHRSSTRTSSKLFDQPDEDNPWATSTPAASPRAIYVGPPEDLLTLGSGAPPKLPQRPPSHARNSSASNSSSTWGTSTTNAMFATPRTPNGSTSASSERPPPQQQQTQVRETIPVPDSSASPSSTFGAVVPKSNNPFSGTSTNSMKATTSNTHQNPFAPPIPSRPPPPLPSTFSFSSPPTTLSTSSPSILSSTTLSPTYVTSPTSSTPDYFSSSSSSNAPLQFNFNPTIRSHNPTPSPNSSSTLPPPAATPTDDLFFSSPAPPGLVKTGTLLSASTGNSTGNGMGTKSTRIGTPTKSPTPGLDRVEMGLGTPSPSAATSQANGAGGKEKEKEVEEKLRKEITRLVQESMKDLIGAQDQVVNLFEAWRIQDSPRPSGNDSPRPSTSTSAPTSTSTTNPLQTRPESPDHETATFLANFPELPPDQSEPEPPHIGSSSATTNPLSQRSIPNLSFHTQRTQNHLINTLTSFLLQQTLLLQSQSQAQSASSTPSATEERTTLLARAERAEQELKKGEFERRREGERIDMERMISGEKLINMKSEIERLKGQAKKDQEEHSEVSSFSLASTGGYDWESDPFGSSSPAAQNLENATLHAGFLQERINVLEQALNDMDGEMAGNSSRNQRDREVEEAGDNVWREIVDQQTDLLGNHTKALATLTTSLTCGICSELMNGPTTLLCGHSGCLLCFQAWFERGNNNCPECRKEGVNGGGVGLAPAYALMDVVRELKAIGLGEGED